MREQKDRLKDATSNETLSEIEEEEELDDDSDSGRSEIPAPDAGSTSTTRKQPDDAGPM